MDLSQRQFELEQEMVDIGVKKYQEAMAKALESGQESTLPPQHKLMQACITPLAEAIREEVAAKGKAGRNKTALVLLEGLSPEVVAYITAQVILNSISVKNTTINIERGIAVRLKDYVVMETFKKNNPNLYKYAALKAQESNHTQYRMNRMRHYANWDDSNTAEIKTNLLTGAYLLEMFIQTTGLVTKVNVKLGGKTKQYLEASPEVQLWITQAHKEAEVMSPFFLPMVVKPEPWTNPYDGGYLTMGLPVIKVRNQHYLQELESADLSKVYRAINAVQETPWRIKKSILEVAQEIWDNDSENTVMPNRVDLDVPTGPMRLP